MYQCFIPFSGQRILYTIFYLSICQFVGHLGCFYILTIMNTAAIMIHVQVSVQTYVLISLGYIPRSGIAGPYSNSMFNILRNCQIDFQSRCTILHSYQQCMLVPISPHPCGHVLLSLSFIIAILMGVK